MSPAFIFWTLCCPEQHAILGKQAEVMMTLAVKGVFQISKKRHDASYDNCYNLWDWAGMSSWAHLSLDIC